MAAFNRDRSRGGNFRRGGFEDRGSGGGGRGFDRPAMHQAVCDKCRKDCEVPFRPTSGKPVYCRTCFDRPTSNRSEGRSFENRGYSQDNRNIEAPRPQYDQQFAALNSKLDKILDILMPIVAEAEDEAETETEEIVEEKIKAPKKSASKKK